MMTHKETDCVGDVLYSETQQARQASLWLFIGGLTLFMWYAAYRQFITGDSLGAKPAPDAVMATLWAFFGIGFPVFFYLAQLTVKVSRNDGGTLCLRYFPFHLSMRSFSLGRTVGVTKHRFHPLLEYGGWGLRWNPARGWAYIISGRQGIDIELEDGTHILIGTKRPEEFLQALLTACSLG